MNVSLQHRLTRKIMKTKTRALHTVRVHLSRVRFARRLPYKSDKWYDDRLPWQPCTVVQLQRVQRYNFFESHITVR